MTTRYAAPHTVNANVVSAVARDAGYGLTAARAVGRSAGELRAMLAAGGVWERHSGLIGGRGDAQRLIAAGIIHAVDLRPGVRGLTLTTAGRELTELLG